MLLRRFLTHFRAQDWMAIVLDFVIVVVGIFVGLQVDSWNQERKERQQEQASLVQLHEDFGMAAEQAQEMAEFHATKIADLEFAQGVILKESLAQTDRWRFMGTIMGMFQMPPIGVTMGTYESMVASGDLALIKDAKLKSMLVRLNAALEAEASYLAYFRDFHQHDIHFPRQHFPIVANRDRSDVRFDFDFEQLVDDPLTLSIIANQHRTHGLFRGFRQDIADQFSETKTYIGTLIDAEVSQADD